MTPMDDIHDGVAEGRRHLIAALDEMEKRRDQSEQVEQLRETVGTLATMLSGWEHERDRWR